MNMETSGTAASLVAPDGSGVANMLDLRPLILLVDDQPARLVTYEAILAGLPMRTVRSSSGNEALQQLLKQDFAAILLDVNMPDMDGFEVARLIRGHPRLERTPIIFVTGFEVSALDQLKGYEVGAIDYISVPIVPEILRSKVAVLVELHQRHRELQSSIAHSKTRAPNLIRGTRVISLINGVNTRPFCRTPQTSRTYSTCIIDLLTPTKVSSRCGARLAKKQLARTVSSSATSPGTPPCMIVKLTKSSSARSPSGARFPLPALMVIATTIT